MKAIRTILVTPILLIMVVLFIGAGILLILLEWHLKFIAKSESSESMLHVVVEKLNEYNHN